MAWLFLLLAAGAAVFMLPGGKRSMADRRLAQTVAFVAVSGALFAFGLKPLGAFVLVIAGMLYGISWLKTRLLGSDTDEGAAPDPSSQADARQRGRFAPRPSKSAMSREEALQVLGLSPDADPQAVQSAHRRMIAKAHPDNGGSDYLAAKVNLARETLLEE